MTDHPDINFHRQQIASGQLPLDLFKYINISDQLLESLNRSELRFVSPYTFNDPFDSQIKEQTKWTKESIQSVIDKNPQTYTDLAKKALLANPPDLFGKFFSQALTNSISKIGVTCFSRRPDNLLLWSHYAKGHEGICLKFNITHDPNFFVWTLPMKYPKDYPVLDYVVDSRDLVGKIITTKSIHWKYEEEIRTLQKTSGIFTHNPQCLTEIIFGCKTPPDEINKVRSLLSNPKLSHVKFKQIRLKQLNFGVDIIDL